MQCIQTLSAQNYRPATSKAFFVVVEQLFRRLELKKNSAKPNKYYVKFKHDAYSMLFYD